MRSGSTFQAPRFYEGSFLEKWWGEGGSCEHLLGAPRVRVAVLNFTLFKGSTIEATRERKVTPRPHPLFLWPQLYKDLNNLEWSMGRRTIPSDGSFNNCDPLHHRCESAIQPASIRHCPSERQGRSSKTTRPVH